jgi:thiol-disulfide isomerase/thioredoxin
MKKLFALFALVSFCLAGCRSTGVPHQQQLVSPPPKPLDIRLPLPTAEPDREYLGLASGAGDFSLGQVKAQAIIIEIFNMYCPHCQREAPQVNELFRLIQDSGLGEKMKLIGIGANNSEFEVQVFKKKYEVPFPMLPDKSFLAANQLIAAAQTPSFVVLKMEKNGEPSLVYSLRGPFKTPQAFLDEAMRSAQLN